MSSLLLFHRRASSALRFGGRRLYSAGKSTKKFDKILIANRGEIACRIMKSAQKMGIKTVAVHSEIDMYAKHVLMADEAVNIGPAPSNQSYLCVDKIIKACLDTGAQAVHPGYGFLSENQAFVAALEANNITFIGPPSSAIYAMGDKIESKKIAKQAGVHIIPGFEGEVESIESACEIASLIGYPVMIKASAGGGGKGMRVAHNDEEVAEGFRLSKQEAKAAFGDDRLLIEKFVENPRHIEIQVLCDSHGNCLYLNERECSIQRRNQKVVEEAPSPFLTPEVRKMMGEQAVALCKRVGYVSAGTCEMMVDGDRNFYFLEMNTRLQVEHPITEYITGVDLVEWMIRIAQGEKLTLQQSDIGIHGWAVEARVYAEDPLRGFLPSIGKLTTYQEPVSENDEIRVDSGILEGSEISVYYDPLIAKVVTHGPTRQDAIDTMIQALDSYLVRGVTHNINFLRDVMTNQKFLSGNLTTAFIPEEFPKGFHGHQLTTEERYGLVALAASLHDLRQLRNRSVGPKDQPAQTLERYVVRDHQKNAFHVIVSVDSELNSFSVGIDTPEGEIFIQVSLESYMIDSSTIFCNINGDEVVAQLYEITDLGFKIQFCGTVYPVEVLTPREAELSQYMKEPVSNAHSNHLLSPMAGTLISVSVKPGDKVFPGQELAVVEAMKMQNVLRAEDSGVVKKVGFKAGDSVLLDALLIEFEESPKEE